MLLITVCDKPSPHSKEMKRQSTNTETHSIRSAVLVLRVTACIIQGSCKGKIVTRIQDMVLSRGPVQLSRYSYSLWAERSGDRIPVWVIFSAPVQTGSGAHPSSYIMGTWSFQGIKRPGRGVDHSPQLALMLKKG